jgi:hypothetical protein
MDGKTLSSFIPNSSFADKRQSQVHHAWNEWLKDFNKLNHLNIPFYVQVAHFEKPEEDIKIDHRSNRLIKLAKQGVKYNALNIRDRLKLKGNQKLSKLFKPGDQRPPPVPPKPSQ